MYLSGYGDLCWCFIGGACGGMNLCLVGVRDEGMGKETRGIGKQQDRGGRECLDLTPAVLCFDMQRGP